MTLSLLRMPMFGFFGLGFLFFAAVVAVAVWLAVRSGEKGSTKLGGFAGCAIALALLVIAGLGALGCTAIALLNTPNEIVRRGPVKSIELHASDEHGSHGQLEKADEGADEDEAPETDSEHAVSLRFVIEGVEPGQITRWIREHTDGDVSYSITTGAGEDGNAVHLDISLPITDRELHRMRADFHRDFPNLRLPESIKLELHHDHDDE